MRVFKILNNEVVIHVIRLERKKEGEIEDPWGDKGVGTPQEFDNRPKIVVLYEERRGSSRCLQELTGGILWTGLRGLSVDLPAILKPRGRRETQRSGIIDLISEIRDLRS